VADMNAPLIALLKAAISTGKGVGGIRFSRNTINGHYIEDAYIYRLQEWIGWVMFPAVLLTVAGFWLISTENHLHPHLHQEAVHTHLHNHKDIHHIHEHAESAHEPHVHEHKHREENHVHSHWPDTHHRHDH
jgi:hypothetical protein